MVKNLKNNDGGFTIVEMLVTILVAVILISSLSNISSNNAFLAQRGENQTSATSFINNTAEELRSKGYLSATVGTTDITSSLPADLGKPKSASLVITEPTAGLKLVSISISYSQQGKIINQNYKTYIGELGVGQY